MPGVSHITVRQHSGIAVTLHPRCLQPVILLPTRTLPNEPIFAAPSPPTPYFLLPPFSKRTRFRRRISPYSLLPTAYFLLPPFSKRTHFRSRACRTLPATSFRPWLCDCSKCGKVSRLDVGGAQCV